jgi:hypothetical protein
MKIIKFLKYQIYYLSFVIFILSFIFGYQIKPLIFLTFCGGFILHNIYPNYYKTLTDIIPIEKLILYDFIIHWIPFIMVLFIYKKQPINWKLVSIILFIYLIYSYPYLYDIYFNHRNFYKN